MGAAASTEHGATVQQYRSSVLNGKPLDASDVKSLDEAKDEIKRLRELASSAFNGESFMKQNEIKGAKRAAVMDACAIQDYVKKSIPKSDVIKKLIHNAIRSNTLFRACSEEELVELIDVFDVIEFKAGSTVIKQGDEGEHFYVVESGTLDITVAMKDDPAKGSNEVQVGVPYVPGSAFGELALMYGSPRAATIRAKEDCKLWSIDRRAFRGIKGQYKLRETEMQLQFLRRVKIGEKILGDVLKSSDIDAMALATQQDTFRKGDVIVREGEKGDIFYLIEKGSVDVFKKETGDKPIATLKSGQFFGERALLTEDVRQATCIAAEDIKCLFLMRQDFNLMLGDLQDLLDGNVRNEDKAVTNEKALETDTVDKYELKDLEVLGTLGVGAFGRVKLVRGNKKLRAEIVDDNKATEDAKNEQEDKKKYDDADKSTKEEIKPEKQEKESQSEDKNQSLKIDSDDKRSSSNGNTKATANDTAKETTTVTAPVASTTAKTYALKILSKSTIVESGLEDHVLTEKTIMEELNHPFILTFHCGMQDDKYIYFLLEVLLGGELFKFLRAETQFPESWSRFYSASVVLAFCELHERKIAYRDLKPENLVLDTNGFLKLVDFGLAKKVNTGKTWTLCGTPDYLAPEVILNEGHDWAVDYWALGVLIYEMTAGSPPFYADDPMEVYEKILSGHVSIPNHFSRGLSDLVKKLLRTYQSKRLGRTKGGTAAIMKHKWFSGFDWKELTKKNMKVPIKPEVKSMEDLSNFDEYPEEDELYAKPCPEWQPEL